MIGCLQVQPVENIRADVEAIAAGACSIHSLTVTATTDMQTTHRGARHSGSTLHPHLMVGGQIPAPMLTDKMRAVCATSTPGDKRAR